MAFAFGKINVASKKHVINLRTIDTIVLVDQSRAYASYSQPVVVLADQYYNEYQIKSIRTFLEANRITRYKIVTALNCIATKEQIKQEQKSGLVDFYRNNASDFWNEVPENAILITAGAALYAVTMSDDVYPDYTHQRIFGVSQFWFSRDVCYGTNLDHPRGNWIFPIESFTDIFAYGFSAPPVDSFKTKLAQFQFKTIVRNKQFPPPRFPQITKVYINTREEFDAFYEEHKHRTGELLAEDLETSGFNFLQDKIGCITLSFDGKTGYYIRWDAVDKEKLNDILSKNIQLGANLKFDVKFLLHEGITAARIDEDIVMMGHTLDETRSNSLKTLAYLYSEFGGYDWALEEYKRKTKIDNYLDIPEEILREYAVMDAIVTWRVFHRMLKHMRSLDKKYPNEKGYTHNLESYYKTIRIPAANMYAHIEYYGVPVSMERLNATREKILRLIAEVKQKLSESFEVSPLFDFDSSTKLGKLLEEKGWEDLGRTKAGHYQCSDDQLALWAKSHSEAALIQEMRTLNVFLKTFVGTPGGGTGWTSLLQYHPEDDSYRLHGNYNPLGTDSGRTRCREPNLMNVPTRGKVAKDIKSCIVPPNEDEYYLMTVDYAAMQLRLASLDGDDPALTDLFRTRRDADVHTRTAYNVFVKNRLFDITEITVEQDGKAHTFLDGQQVETVNRGYVFARDLTEHDTLVVD
jgi:DNA polymerase I-like protein with 3'-5' exonuclease and polymerase domains